MKNYALALLLSVFLLGGCTVNPVTGENQLTLVSEAQELEIGRQQYAPMRQAQGGDYVVDPQLSAYVSEVGQRLAAASDRKLPYEFRVLNNSTPNAWALPGGKIVLNRGLLTELESEAEMAAVLGHEITHAAARHSASNITRSMLLQGAMMATVLATQDKDYAQLAQIGAGIGAQLISQKYGRDAEREADYYGMKYMSKAGYDTQGAVELQKTFVKLSEGQQQNWLSGLFSSHPPSQERVQNNVKTLEEFPSSGAAGRERFRSRTAQLKRTKPAYEAYDKGRKALADGDAVLARQLAQKANRLVPREAHFEALLGDVEEKRGNSRTALTHYNKALQLNDDFFYYHLKKGVTHEKLGERQQAKVNLERSIQLLPTANAFHSLGNIARSERRFADAKSYYAKAAQDQTETGQLAYASLVELDLADNPGKYLKVELRLDNSRQVFARITNATPVDVKDITLSATYVNAAGRKRGGTAPLRGVLAAGKSVEINLELSNLEDAALRSLRASITRASLAR